MTELYITSVPAILQRQTALYVNMYTTSIRVYIHAIINEFCIVLLSLYIAIVCP